MAEISKIKTLDGQTHNLKDNTARQRMLPIVSAADNGKVLMVNGGVWVAQSIINGNEVEY